jgi:hypothetical protein
MTLPTIAGVQSRIHTLPGRPPFMTVYDLAEFYEVTPKRIMEQVRRNPGRFTEGFIFNCQKEEMAVLIAQNAASNRVQHGILVGFTEKGALQLSSVLTGPVADAVSVLIINAFIALRDQERSDMANAMARFRDKFIGKVRMRAAIADAVRDGRDYAYLRSLYRSVPQWALVQEIRDSLFFGTIASPPKGTPMHLRQPTPKVPVVTPETDPRQLSLLEV